MVLIDVNCQLKLLIHSEAHCRTEARFEKQILGASDRWLLLGEMVDNDGDVGVGQRSLDFMAQHRGSIGSGE